MQKLSKLKKYQIHSPNRKMFCPARQKCIFSSGWRLQPELKICFMSRPVSRTGTKDPAYINSCLLPRAGTNIDAARPPELTVAAVHEPLVRCRCRWRCCAGEVGRPSSLRWRTCLRAVPRRRRRRPADCRPLRSPLAVRVPNTSIARAQVSPSIGS